MPFLGGCTEACGWFAASISVLGFGSFGAPIKSKTISKLDIHPLVMQSYKTMMCFLTCWLIIPMGEKFRFTSWGILSGLFWVPGATCGIFGIRNAGLAISVGIWSAMTVLSSFIWGVFVFGEPIRSLSETCAAVSILIVGLVGMAKFSAPPIGRDKRSGVAPQGDPEKVKLTLSSPPPSEKGIDLESDMGQNLNAAVAKRKVVTKNEEEIEMNTNMASKLSGSNTSMKTSLDMPLLIAEEHHEVQVNGDNDSKKSNKEDNNSPTIVYSLFGGRVRLSQRSAGILGAMINGTWGSNSMIPMHYANEAGYGGPGYLISFACGAAIVTVLIWLVYFLVLARSKGVMKGYQSLPSFHVREMWVPGFLSGTLYSIGNFGSMIAIIFLGQAIGFMTCQASMLVSGLWGIVYYKEVRGWDLKAKWFLSALLTVMGIIWLGQQHAGPSVH